MEVNLSNLNKKFNRMRALAFALAIALGVSFSAHKYAFGQQAQQPAVLTSPAELSRVFINVAKQVKPAVVNIDVIEKTKRTALSGSEGLPQIPGFPPFGEMQPRRQRGTGSGVIISPDGYILTNNHVAGDAAEISVKMSDGREFKARRIGTDPETDLAVIKVNAQNLAYARLGDSDKLEQGEWVIALGSPFGLEQTMTAGIVSATGRSLRGAYDNYIQTDASINPGNSGGPLVNMAGEVVGINTMIFSRSGGSEGIGFSIPSNLASKVYGQLVKNGKVTRGYLGVNLQPLTSAMAKTLGVQATDGALVGDVANDHSPAAKAGLHSGDVIVEFDGKAVKSPRQLTEVVADTPVGKAVQVKYVRDGRTEATSIRLGERPGAKASERADDSEATQGTGKLGISIATVTPEVASELKLKISTGAVIQNVQPDGPAAEAGLRRGDVVHRVNRTPVATADDLTRAIRALKGEKEVVLQVERSGQLSFITVNLEE